MRKKKTKSKLYKIADKFGHNILGSKEYISGMKITRKYYS